MKTNKISVREIVEFVLRTGDIGGAGAAMNVERAWEGTRLHRKLQEEGGGGYRREVALSETVSLSEHLEITVEGRADGIYLAGGVRDTENLQQSLLDEGEAELIAAPIWTIDEIKSVSMDVNAVREDLFPLHWAQAQCYAYIYLVQEKLDRIQVRLSYISVEDERVRYFYRTYSKEEITAFWNALIDKYSRFALWEERWRETRNQSAKALPFPFGSYRPGQEEMCEAITDAIDSKRRVFLEAPTGIGKTMSALYPAVKALGEEATEKIFYLTAKTVTVQAPRQAVALMAEKGLSAKSIVIYAKDKICPLEKRKCTAAYCPMARGHYDRVNDAIYAALTRYDLIDREALVALSTEFRVCPFELSLDISLFADIVICDYNYAFDPTVSLKRYFRTKNNFVLLVDEAHNLVERGREMFSADITKKDFLTVKKLFPEPRMAPGLHRAVNRVLQLLEEIAARTEQEWQLYERGADPGDELYFALDRFNNACSAYIEEFKDSPKGVPEDLVTIFFKTMFFLKVWDNPRNPYEFYVHKGETEFMLRFFCIDPSVLLKETYKLVRSVVFFSATLTPTSYYLNMLDEADADYVNLPSPFDSSKEHIVIAPLGVSFQQRDRTLESLCHLIAQTYEAKPGHYFVFFPSFAYMRKTLALFQTKYRHIPVLPQTNMMDDEARAKYLARFESPEPVVGFAVLGGLFAEGIDLTGDRLIGAVVVTVGLPQIGAERDLIQKHLQENRGEGFEYAYVYPGWGRVLQAAGRVIRTEQDRGVVVLVDRRFDSDGYHDLFPAHWNPGFVDEESLPGNLSRFWEEY